MVSGNGQNGHARQPGTLGGSGGRYVRSGLRLMQRVVATTDSLPLDDLNKALAFARSVMDDEGATQRNRLRAGELIETVMGRLASIADRAEHYERLDDGEPTDRNESFTIEIPKARTL